MKLSEYAKKYGCTYQTALNHWNRGMLKGKQLATGTIVIFDDADNDPSEVDTKTYAIYCRVSSHDQSKDLISQQERLLSYCSAKGYIVSEIVCETASGLNDNRPKLNKLLSSNYNIIIEHRDRLTRFGFNYIHTLMGMQGRELIVINPVINQENEIMDDFVSIITSMCARIYGTRRSKRKTTDLVQILKHED
jgi:predicted site-specific integrase-resolvase